MLHYSLAIIKNSYENLNKYLLPKPAANCSVNGLEWAEGKKVYELITTNTEVIAGQKIEFDEDGDRITTEFNIINLNKEYFIRVGVFKVNNKNT